jgi:hypothetical protein
LVRIPSAYQAQIEGLLSKFGNLDALTICPLSFGSGREGTLTFNEFIGLSNGEYNGPENNIPSITDNQRPDVDRMANILHKGSSLMKNTWPGTQNIVQSTGYIGMLEHAGKVVWEWREVAVSQDSALKATRAIQMVVKSRQIDYERYRMPELEAHFSDVKFVTWDLQLQAAPNAKELDLAATIENNPGVNDLADKINSWVEAYHGDTSLVPGSSKTKGANRLSHLNAMKAAQRTETFAIQGHCS